MPLEINKETRKINETFFVNTNDLFAMILSLKEFLEFKKDKNLESTTIEEVFKFLNDMVSTIKPYSEIKMQISGDDIINITEEFFNLFSTCNNKKEKHRIFQQIAFLTCLGIRDFLISIEMDGVIVQEEIN